MRYVVDENMMRHPDLAVLVRDESGPDFVLPDTAFVEMCKGARWEETMRCSLALLGSVPRRVHVAMSYGHAMRRELETWRPTQGEDLLPGDQTRLVRRIMAALASGGTAFDELRVEIGGMRRRLLDEQADAVAEKVVVKGLIDAFVGDAGGTRVAAVRRPGPDGERVRSMDGYPTLDTFGSRFILECATPTAISGPSTASSTGGPVVMPAAQPRMILANVRASLAEATDARVRTKLLWLKDQVEDGIASIT